MGNTKFRREKKYKQNQKEEQEETTKLNRMQRQIESDLSPKYTEMKTGVRTSRFGRPQKEAQQDLNSIPTEVAKFVSKSSPKRFKPKESNLEHSEEGSVQTIFLEDKENFKENGVPENVSEDEQEQFTVIKEEGSTNSLSMQIDEKDLEICEKNVEVFRDFPLKAPSECNSSKQENFSDTDSALGNDIKNNNNNGEFAAGHILWGSFGKTSWFPCMAYPLDDDGTVISEKGKMKQIYVKYFNYNGFTASLQLKNVFEFKDLDHFFEKIKSLGIKKAKLNSFTKTCYKAIEEATFFSKYPLEERVKLFDEVLKHQLENKRKSIDSKVQRSDDRKSIDSAVETGTAPSSPNPSSDPIECYLKTMERYEAFTGVEPKKEKKMTTPKPAVKVEEKEITNRRKSGRVVKKRKFEDFFEEKPQTSAAAKLDEVNSPSLEPKKKKPKIAKEETLEERFLINYQDLKTMFHKVTKKRACMECCEITADVTHRCMGHGNTKCAGWFHEACAGQFEMKREEIRHQCGDSDEIIQTNQLKPFLVCKRCHVDEKSCLACNQTLAVEDADPYHCPNPECRLSYHKKCLDLWPQTKVSKGNNSKRSSLCPQHTCHTCFSKDIHNSGTLVKCLKCPAAYHLTVTCIPAGTKIISQSQIICPRHPTEKEMNRNSKEKVSKPLNIDWCNVCLESGSLVCCESCPSAFHPQCIGYEETEENFHCDECKDGRLPLYNTIVWARVGAYRWWPGLVMPDQIVPESTLKSKKNEREFCVRFFGSYDYFWFTCERVFNYDGTNLSVKSGNSRIDFAFNTALDEAEAMALLLESDNPQQMTSKPKPYTKLLSNRPIAPVKLKKIDEQNQEICTCSPDDPNPCGGDSDCINMSLHFECSKLNCPAGALCQNQKLQNREYAELKVIKTNHRGFGAVTVKDLPENTFVIEYVGDLINTVEFNRRMKAKIDNKEKEFYFLTIESDLYVDAEPAGNQARFINHSCNPNCDTRKVTVDGNTRIGIFTNQFIPANTELTFDYQMEFVGNKKTPCFCGTPNCSGLIGEKPKEEKRPSLAKKKIKSKKRPTVPQLNLQPSTKKRRRTLEDVKDPIEKMLEQMPLKSEETKSDEKIVL